MRALRLLWLASLASLTLAASCPDSPPQGGRHPQPAPERPPPTLRMVVLTDLQGTLEPCGCTSRPLGGIDRMAAKLAELRREDVPTLVVHAGDTLFGPAEHGTPGEGLARQDRWRAQTVAEVLGRLELAAATPGARDLEHGPGPFSEVTRNAGFPWLAAGLELAPNAAASDSRDDDDAEGRGAPSSKTSAAAGRDHEPSEDPGHARSRADGSDEGASGHGGSDRGTSDHRGGGEAAASTRGLVRGGVIRQVGPLRVALVGVGTFDPAPTGVRPPSDPIDAARQTLEALAAQEPDLVVALAHGTRRTARTAARELDVDFVVQGGLSEADPIPPVEVDGRLVLHAGRQGQGLLVLDVYRRSDAQRWIDVGELGQRVERERLDRRIDELRSRIERWEADESVDPADVAAQRKRLGSMEKERDALEAPRALPAKRNATAARYLELAPEAPRSDTVTALLERFFERVNAYNKKAYADLEPPPVDEGEASYVGSQECATCHQSAYDWWKPTPHGRAYATLETRHKEYNLSCVGCHVTGYSEPGGSTVTHVEALKNVGCESCHGPGSLHAAAPGEATLPAAVPESTCIECHNAEHSDLFHYEAYKNVLVMPGHGLPVDDAG